MAAHAPIIDQAFLQKLERLTLHWQQSFGGLVGGRIPSRTAGSGQEFLDHRNFHHGDDLRGVNWRAYLRLEKLFLKMFHLEPRIPVRLLVDVSQSMELKFDYARRLAAALTYVGLVRLDSICIQGFRNALEDSHLCTGGRHRILPAVQFLSELKLGGKTDYLAVSRQFASMYPQRGLIIVISDFLDDGDVERPLQYLADFGHELTLIQLWSPQDRNPEWDGELELLDSETGERMELSVDERARASYTEAFDAHSRRLQDLASRTGGRYIGLATDTPVEDALFGTLMRGGVVQ
jgi:uncharacterized protein (DUF58 family)